MLFRFKIIFQRTNAYEYNHAVPLKNANALVPLK